VAAAPRRNVPARDLPPRNGQGSGGVAAELALEHPGKVLGRLEPLFGILRQAAGHDRAGRVVERLGVVAQHRRQTLGEGGAGEGAPPGEQLVEDGADGEEVAAGVGRLAARLLGRQVARGAEEGPRLGLVGVAVAAQLGQAEVEDLERAVAGDDEVPPV
jgi:hypothetical protein